MTVPGNDPGDAPESLADRVAETVLQHPCVRRLDGGEFGTIASYLPGRTIVGVRAEPGEHIEISAVLQLDHPLPEIVADLRGRVAALAGPVTIDITVSDIVTARDTPEDSTETGR